MPKSKNINIKYTSREFDSIKEDLVNYAKRYYPDSYKDFTNASFGSMVLDSVAYIGDVLSYYVDYSVNESFLDTAVEFENVRKHARS
jgi:restriction endonuclease S subunit